MSTSVYKLEKDLCRCCHAEGSFHNLADPVYNLGQKEVYSDMLKTSLDIEVSPVPGELSMMTYTICEACVLRLRDAHNFRQQVELCESRFREMYKNIIVDKTIDDLKDESSGTLDKDVKRELDDGDDGFDVRFDDSDDEQPIIKVKVEEAGKPKSRTKQTKPRTKTKKASSRKSRLPSDSEKTLQDGDKGEDVINKRKKEDEDPPYVVTEVDGVSKYGCTACHKTFKRKSHCTEHYKHAHQRFGAHFTLTKAEDGSDDYNCNSCGKTWKKFMYFRQHFKNVHQKVVGGKCDVCGLKLPSVKRARHMEEAHGIPAPICNICNKKFAFPSQVLRHQKIIHMGEANYECQTCLKRFPTHDRWKRHQIVHSTVREDTCNYCGKSFKWKKSLQAHIRIHLEDRRYVCKICGEAFVHGTSLRYHRTKKHPNSV